MEGFHHDPVLLAEVIRYLDPQPGESYVDATLGGGGYSKAILDRVGPDGKVLAIDLDLDAIENFKLLISNSQTKSQTKNPKIQIAHGNFRDIDKIVRHHQFEDIAGVVADLGLSSYQLDQSGRGISFQKDEPLDMRFDQSSQTEDAKFIVNNYTEGQLTAIFQDYGEERFARSIARKIVGIRNKTPIKHTNELFEAIQIALPPSVRHKAADSARRIFQSLRIAVNHELDSLQDFLPKAFDLVRPGGRLVVVTFHSLEDRIVKHYFQGLTRGCVCPPDFPQCICGKNPQGKLLVKKPVTAGEEELARNSRSKPAKLRAIQKL